jgi:uncharacterized protein (TIGR03067 family)
MTRSGILLPAVTSLLVFAACGLAREAPLSGPDESRGSQTERNDLIRISGVFTVVHFEHDGNVTPAAALQQMKVFQNQADWSFHNGAAVTRGRDAIVAPGPVAHIDCVYRSNGLEGQKLLGIVKVEGDQVRYCWAGVGEPRPTTFATGPNSGLTMFVLQRVPPATPQEKKEPAK